MRRKRALNCWPWVQSLSRSPEAVVHSAAAIVAAWPATVTTSRSRELLGAERKAFSYVVVSDTFDQARQHSWFVTSAAA